MSKSKQQEAPKPAKLSPQCESDKVVIINIQEMGLTKKELKISSIQIFSFIFD